MHARVKHSGLFWRKVDDDQRKVYPTRTSMEVGTLILNFFEPLLPFEILENEKVESADISGLYYKCFTIIIYDCNNSGQYYKTTIMIIIDDPS